MALHTVGPRDMAEDEHKIGSGYQKGLILVYGAIPLVAADFLELKWVVAICASMVIVQLHEVGGRLHDSCIRHRRTNLILNDISRTGPPEELRF